MFERKKLKDPSEGEIRPFRIIGNVWFVGTYQASVHLIDTGDGLILIDTGYENTYTMVLKSITNAGFDPQDIRYIVNTHWHDDHTGATAAFAALSGAKTLIGERDATHAAQYFSPDILLGEGDVLQLGNIKIRFIETPGHTRGTVSLFFDVQDGENQYRLGMFGGAGANTLAKGKLEYPTAREDYRASLSRLRKEHVDVFIGNHTWNNNTEEHGKLLRETGENRFIDQTLFHRFLDFCEARLNAIEQAE